MLPRKQAGPCDHKDGRSNVDPLYCGVVPHAGRGIGNKDSTIFILHIKDIGIQQDGKLSSSSSSSQILMVHSSGCTAVGISKFLSHARALTHM